MKDDKIKVTGDNLRISTQAIHFAQQRDERQQVEDRDSRHHLDHTSPFCPINKFPRAQREAHDAHAYT